MRLFVLLVLCVSFLQGFAQQPNSGNTPAAYPGGLNAFNEYVKKSIRYPIIPLENDIEGIVEASIKIDSAGNVVEVEAVSRDDFFKNAVIPKLKLMPKWIPATANGKPIDTIVQKTIYFSINKTRINGDTALAEVLVVPRLLTDGMATKLYNAGVKLLQEGNYLEAIKKFDQSEAFVSGQADLLYNRGVAYYQINEQQKACADWLEATRFGDKDAIDVYNSKCKK